MPRHPGWTGQDVRGDRSHMHFEVRSGWRGHEGHFARRVGCFTVLMVGAIFILGGVTVRLVFGDLIGDRDGDGPPFHALVLLLPLGLVMWAIVRSLRRTAEPISAVMAAAERVAEGDYAVRVEPHGSPDVQHLIATFNGMTERLESNEQQRRMLLADIAHELRNPLAIIRGTVEGVIDGVYEPTEAELKPLLDEIQQMTRLLDDLQTLSLAESGHLSLHMESIDVARFVEEVASVCEIRIRDAGVALVVDTSGGGEVDADPVRLRQVIENVVENAIRHTPSGGSIAISTQVGAGRVRIVVADTGSGIAPEALPYIFDRFTKAADSGGSGLGLAIARRLIEAHGGQISATSTPGAGTTITIGLPLENEQRQ